MERTDVRRASDGALSASDASRGRRCVAATAGRPRIRIRVPRPWRGFAGDCRRCARPWRPIRTMRALRARRRRATARGATWRHP